MKMENQEEKVRNQDWSQLPTEILELFCKRLSIPEQIRFGSVCKSWLSSTSNKSYLWVPDTPWLITNDDSSSQYQLLSNSDKKIFKIYKPFKPLHGSFIVGSFKGWLVIRAETKLFLLNLFSKVRIELPPQSTMPVFLRSKGVNTHGMDNPLSFAISTCSKLNPISIAMVTYGGDLAWCNIGDKAWKGYRGDEDYGNLAFLDDKIYAINRDGEKVHTFKVDDESQVLLQVGSINSLQPKIKSESIDVYLVECRGRLLVVKRYYDNSKLLRPTMGFNIFKVEENCSPPQLVEVGSLEDQVLFLADNSCESLPAKFCPGLRAGRIYFTGYASNSFSSELGEFSLTDGTMLRVPLTDPVFDSPVWVLPRFAFECNCKLCNSARWIRPKKKKKKKKCVQRKTNVLGV